MKEASFQAKLFSLQQSDVENIEAWLEETKAWAEHPVVETPLPSTRPLDRRYGYIATLQGDDIDDEAIVLGAANWNEWQEIVRHIIATVISYTVYGDGPPPLLQDVSVGSLPLCIGNRQTYDYRDWL